MADDSGDRIRAQEPTVIETPAEAPADADIPDGATDAAPEGVTFFEGGDGREEAQGDIERNG